MKKQRIGFTRREFLRTSGVAGGAALIIAVAFFILVMSQAATALA